MGVDGRIRRPIIRGESASPRLKVRAWYMTRLIVGVEITGPFQYIMAMIRFGTGTALRTNVSVDYSLILCLTDNENEDPSDSSSIWV